MGSEKKIQAFRAVATNTQGTSRSKNLPEKRIQESVCLPFETRFLRIISLYHRRPS